MTRALALFAFALSTAVGAAAQLPDPVKSIRRELPDETAFTQGIVRRLRALDVDGNKGKDVAFVRGQELFFAADIEVMNRYSRPGVLGVDDVAILPQLPGATIGDVVLVVGPGGTRVLGYGAAGFRVVPLGAWPNVARVESTRHPTDPTRHLLVGLELNRTTLRLGCFVPGQGLVEVVAPLQLPTLRDFTLADWNGDGILDVVVRTAGEVRGYGMDGVLLSSAPTTASSMGGGLARVAITESLDRIVAANFDSSSMRWRLDVFRAGILIDSSELPNTTTTAVDVDLAAGDYDADGCDDLLVQGLNESSVYLFRHRGVEASYRADEMTALALDVTADSVVVAPALFADINNDVVDDQILTRNSAADLVFAIGSDSRLQCFTGLRHLHELPEQDGFADGDYPDIFEDAVEYIHGEGVGNLRYLMVWPEEYGDATHLKISVWRHDNVPNPSELIHESELIVDLHNWEHNVSTELDVPVLNPVTSSSAVGFWRINRPYYVTMRFVVKNAAGDLIGTSPCYLSAYAADEISPITYSPQDLYEYWLRLLDRLQQQPLEFGGTNRFVGAFLRRDVEPPAELAGLPGL